MSRRPFILWFAGGLVAGLGFYLAAQSYYSSQRTKLWNASGVQSWDRNVSDQVAVQRMLLEKRLTLKGKWETALGGPVEVAAKDPTLSIREMVEATARACVGSGTKVQLDVDRFTEFTLTLELGGNKTRRDMAEIGACILQHCGPYLQALRFARKGELLAELGPESLALVSNWEALSPLTVTSLLDRSEASTVSKTGLPRKISIEPEQETAEQKKIRKAEDDFDSLTRSYFESFGELIRSQDSAANLGTIQNISEIDTRIAGLNKAGGKLNQARSFFEKSETEYATILSKAGFDRLFVQVSVRGYLERTRQQRNNLVQICDRVEERQKATTNFLATMRQYSGEWRPMENGKSISFDNLQVQDAYRAAMREFEVTSSKVEEAFKFMGGNKGTYQNSK